MTTTAIREHLSTVTGRTVTPDEVADALGILHRLGLATIGPDRSIRVHALLQRAVRDTLTDTTTTTTLAHIAAASLLDAWPEIDTRDLALAPTYTPCSSAPDAHSATQVRSRPPSLTSPDFTTTPPSTWAPTTPTL